MWHLTLVTWLHVTPYTCHVITCDTGHLSRDHMWHLTLDTWLHVTADTCQIITCDTCHVITCDTWNVSPDYMWHLTLVTWLHVTPDTCHVITCDTLQVLSRDLHHSFVIQDKKPFRSTYTSIHTNFYTFIGMIASYQLQYNCIISGNIFYCYDYSSKRKGIVCLERNSCSSNCFEKRLSRKGICYIKLYGSLKWFTPLALVKSYYSVFKTSSQ